MSMSNFQSRLSTSLFPPSHSPSLLGLRSHPLWVFSLSRHWHLRNEFLPGLSSTGNPFTSSPHPQGHLLICLRSDQILDNLEPVKYLLMLRSRSTNPQGSRVPKERKKIVNSARIGRGRSTRVVLWFWSLHGYSLQTWKTTRTFDSFPFTTWDSVDTEKKAWTKREDKLG